MTLHWDDPGDGSILEYRYSQNGRPPASIPGSGASTTSYAVTGLAACQTYRFDISAVNALGTGGRSDSATASTSCPPGALTGLAAVGGDSEVTLRWDNPQDNSITKYQYHQKEPGGTFGDWTDIAGSGASTVSYTVTKITNCESYTFQVRAVNVNGNGRASGAVTATAGAASACSQSLTGFVATGLRGQVTLRWVNPQDNSITKHQYRQKEEGGAFGNWTDIAGSGSSTVSHAVTGLGDCKSYTFQVRAVNASGQDSESRTVTASTACPPWPITLKVAGGEGKVTLSWNNPQDSSISKYQYRQTESGDVFGSWTDIAGSGASIVSHVVTGLANCQSYTFEIRTVTASGEGSPTGGATGTTDCLPEGPTGLTAAGGNSQVTLNWTDPQDSSITKYQYRQKVSGGTFGSWTDITGSGAGTASHVVTGLTNCQSYTFEIRSVTASRESSSSGSASAAPVCPPGNPTSLTAVGGERQVTLRWDDPHDGTLTKYQYTLNGGSTWTDIAGSGSSTVSYTVTNLTNCESYTFQVRAVNPSGNGRASGAVTATAGAASACSQGLTGFVATGRRGQVTLR